MEHGRYLGAKLRLKFDETTLLTAVLTVVILALTGITLLSSQIMVGVRGYTSGESLWSKGMNDAASYLTEYARSGDIRDWQEYQRNIEIPMGDRRSRLALEDDSLDAEQQYAIAFDGFLQGGNHPEDIPMMIFMLRWFAWEPHFEEAIETWREGDRHLLALQDLGQAIDRSLENNEPGSQPLKLLMRQVQTLDKDVREVETRFTRIMGETARFVELVMDSFAIGLSIVLLLCGAWLNWRIVQKRHEVEASFRATFEQAAVGMAQVSLDLEWLEVNDKLCRILGYPRERLLDMKVDDVTHPDDHQLTQSAFRQMMSDGLDETSIDKRYCCADGEVIWCNINVRLLRDMRGRPSHFITVVDDVTESRQLTERLTHQASHDALTGLINRYEFENRVIQGIERARTENITNAICFIDLDQFKIINDTCGHGAGDALLKQLGGLLRSKIRSNDTLARLGGDEFALLLEACPPAIAERVANKIRTAIRDMRFMWEGNSFSIGASIGVVPFDGQATGIDTLMSAADAACFTAKDTGRNRVVVADHSDKNLGQHMNAMQWQQRLQNALGEGRFFLLWQPIMNLKGDQDFRDFEVLLRLRDEDGNVVAPGSFLPSAERFGLIKDIDYWVLESLLSWLGTSDGIAGKLHKVAINLSGVTLSEPGFKQDVLDLIDRFSIDPGKLCFEVTETATITHLDIANDFMEDLRKLGCHFSLDDFGMGVSSFSYLNSLPVDTVKIDGTFVRDMDSNPIHAAMVRSINDIAHTMGKETVAEFVENAAILRNLRDIGVDYAQGYGISPPVALGEIPDMVDETK